MTDHILTTEDGRRLQGLESGALDGQPVLVHGGTPSGRLMFGPDVERAERQGVHLISYDRPGYGGSTRQPGRKVADCASDVRAIAAALGIDRLAVWGISGGGPHALACAALLPDLVPAVGVLASCAPWNAPGLDYFAGMGQMNIDDTKLMLDDPEAGRAKHESDRVEMLATGPDEMFSVLNTLLSPVDAEALDRELAEHFVDSGRSALAPGSGGWWDDDMAFLLDWGFELGSIRTPVLLLHGRQDQFVPVAHGEWLAERIPGVQAEFTDDDGHLTLTLRHLERVHDWLLERMDAGRSTATGGP